MDRWRRRRGLLAIGLGCLMLGAGLQYYLAPAAPASAPVRAPTPALAVFAPAAGPPVPVLAVLGAKAGLSDPRDAATLPDGRIVVADTGHSRLVILDAGGQVVATIGSGGVAMQQPDAVVAVRGGFDMLDAGRGAIEYFDANGRFIKEVAHDPTLNIARGLAVGPNGRYYIANPLTNSLVVLSATGQVVQQTHSPLGAGPGQFNQPSAVAVGADGTVYVLDNQNNRIEALTPSGSFLREWPAPPSDTMHSVHILPLPDGRLIATDPSGALLVYGRDGTVTRRPVVLNGQGLTPAQPIGLSRMSGDRLLLADSRGNRLLVVSVPR